MLIAGKTTVQPTSRPVNKATRQLLNQQMATYNMQSCNPLTRTHSQQVTQQKKQNNKRQSNPQRDKPLKQATNQQLLEANPFKFNTLKRPTKSNHLPTHP
jgi:hypothetical protein